MTEFFYNSISNFKQNKILAGLCIFAFGLTLSISITEIGLAIAFVFWLLELKKNDTENFSLTKLFRCVPILKPLVVYIAVAVLTSIFALNFNRAISYMPSDLIKAGSCIFLFIVVRQKMIRPLIISYALGATISALWAVSKTAYFYFFSSYIIRTAATIHPITYGEVIGLAMIFPIIMFCKISKTDKMKYIYFLQIILMGLALLFTQSRGAFLGAAVSMIFLAIIEKHIRKFLLFLLAVAITAILFLSVGSKNFSKRFTSLPVAIYDKISGNEKNKTIECDFNKISASRLVQWNNGWKIIKDYPLLGVGPSNVGIIFNAYYPYPIDGKFAWSNLHNLYIHQTAERGLLGLAALVYLFVSMFILAWKSTRKKKDTYTMWCLCGLVGFFVMNLTETSFQHSLVAMSVFFMLSLSYVCAYEKA